VQKFDRQIVRYRLPPQLPDLGESLHPVLRRVYAARGITCREQLERGLNGLPSPDTLPGIAAAVELIHRILAQGGRILIVADFDADGATSCALALRALTAMGAAEVHYLVPNRFEYGYGLTPEIVAEALKRQPDLIITVDNGISSVAGVERARAAGIAVLVTDHHLPGAELPPADVIVNPQLGGEGAPGKDLAGVGVIFYVMAALRSRLREQGWFQQRALPEPNLAELLDLVALGTVADVVALDRINRILVFQGLQRVRNGQCRAGIEALLSVAGRQPRAVTTTDLGFVVGPRLNAAGRLEDMSVGINCLLTDDPAAARAGAEMLDRLNRERRRIEQEMQDQALQVLEEPWSDTPDELPFGLCLYRPEWHPGVIGILAGRLKDRFHRPAIAFAPDGSGMLKGSARSIAGLHIRDLLESIATRHPGLLPRFGGHAMAAGLSLAEPDLETFRRAFEQELRHRLSPEELLGVIHSDGELRPEEITLELAEAIREGGPWGQGFPEPRFDGRFRILEQRVVGERHWKLRLSPREGGAPLEAIAFNQAPADSLPAESELRVAFRLEVNEYLGVRRPQLVIEHLEQL
jgi:single-stranded-DNA-specific exonuclease